MDEGFKFFTVFLVEGCEGLSTCVEMNQNLHSPQGSSGHSPSLHRPPLVESEGILALATGHRGHRLKMVEAVLAGTPKQKSLFR